MLYVLERDVCVKSEEEYIYLQFLKKLVWLVVLLAGLLFLFEDPFHNLFIYSQINSRNVNGKNGICS